MKTQANKKKTDSPFQSKAKNQLSQSSILQAYKNKTVQQKSTDEEELLQGKFETVQKMGVDEEEPVQGKFEIAQLATDEEELLQGKFETTQLASEEEELLQGKFETVQRMGIDEEEPVQGKFETTQLATEEEEPLQRQPNNTGLPDNLKNGIENLSGYSMNDVKVHYNSSQPATLQAHAYAQGTDIHVAPGQEKHVPHEAWHVVQQKQGRVKATKQMKGTVPVNDDEGLEKEADVMGAKALLQKKRSHNPITQKADNQKRTPQQSFNRNPITSPAQMMPIVQFYNVNDPAPTVNAMSLARFDRTVKDTSIMGGDHEKMAYINARQALIREARNQGNPDISILPVNTNDLYWKAIYAALNAPDPGKWEDFIHHLKSIMVTAYDTHNNLDVTIPGIAAFAGVEPFLNPYLIQGRTTAYSKIPNAGLRTIALNSDLTQPLTGARLSTGFLNGKNTTGLNEPTKTEKAAWILALKSMPTISKLLSGTLFKNEKALPKGNSKKAKEKRKKVLKENKNMKGLAKPKWQLPVRNGNVRFFDRVNRVDSTKVPSNHGIHNKIEEAWRQIKFLMETDILNQSFAPGIRVINPGQNQRAFYDPTTHNITIKADEDVAVIVHEFGHHIEATIDSELWLGAQKLLHGRHERARIGWGWLSPGSDTLERIYRGTDDEAKFKGYMPATGAYSAKAYESGDTEVVSMTMEFLSNPLTAKTLIEKDPQQAALILSKIKPIEYNNHVGNAFNAYLQ